MYRRFGQANPAQFTGATSLYRRLAGLAQLPGTQQEADMLEPLFGVRALTWKAATEQAVHKAHAPRILHIATHGLFLTDTDLPAPVELDSGLRSVSLLADWQTLDEPDAPYRSALILANESLLQAERLPERQDR